MPSTILSFSVALAFLLTLWPPALHADEPKSKSPRVKVTLKAPGETKFSKISPILEKLGQLKTAEAFVAQADRGNDISAELIAPPGSATRTISAIVEVLLESKVKKITIEIKVEVPP